MEEKYNVYRKQKGLCFTITLLFFFAASSLVHATETAGVNKLSLFLDFFFGYDSNIVYYAEDIDDSYYTLLPKILLTLPGEHTFFQVGYSLRYDQYLDHSDFSNTSQNLDLLGRVYVGNNFTLSLKDKFVDSLYGLWRTENDSFVGDGYYVNSLSPILNYESTSAFFSTNVSFTHMFERWDEFDYRDWDSTGVNCYLGFALGAYTKLGLSAAFIEKDYKEIITDYKSTSFGVNFAYTIPEVIDIKAFAGSLNREYNDIDEDSSLFSYELIFSKIFSEITSANVSLYYDYGDSEVQLGDYFTRQGALLDLSYLFREKIQLMVKTEYYKLDYELFERDDTVMRAYTGIGYKFIDWFAIQFFYNYLDRESSLDQYDLSDQRLELHLNIFHDFTF
ncbi:outer membrane beta-barrel protein [bacterium]|nr:outer membrane beta-barrel protein [bacterium]